jgi:putative hemolysin
MPTRIRSGLLTAVVVAAALLLGYVIFRDDVDAARASCLERGGAIVVETDTRTGGLAYVCALPNGDRERL